MPKWFKKSIYSFVLIAALFFLYANKEILFSLKNISLGDLLFLSLFGILTIFINAFQFKYFAKIFDIKLFFKEWFGLTVANTMHNYYTPARGGTILKAVYLKKSHNLKYSTFISLTAGTYLVGFFLASLTAVFFILISYLLYHEFHWSIFIISTGLFFATIFAGFLSLNVEFSAFFKGFPKFYRFASNVENGMFFLKKNKILLLKVLLFKFLFIVIMAIKLHWAFKAIGIETNLISILIVQSLVVFSMVLSLTPGNLGVREGIIGLLASLLGIPLKEAVLGAFVDRAVMMCLVIVLGLIFSKLLAEELDKKLTTQQQVDSVQMENKLL